MFLMTYNYRPEFSYMSPVRDDETESLEQSAIRRDTPAISPISAETQQSE